MLSESLNIWKRFRLVLGHYQYSNNFNKSQENRQPNKLTDFLPCKLQLVYVRVEFFVGKSVYIKDRCRAHTGYVTTKSQPVCMESTYHAAAVLFQPECQVSIYYTKYKYTNKIIRIITKGIISGFGFDYTILVFIESLIKHVLFCQKLIPKKKIYLHAHYRCAKLTKYCIHICIDLISIK